MSNGQSPLSSSFFMAATLLLLACLAMFFYGLGVEEVSTEAQARVLVTAGEMNEAHTWLAPTFGGEDHWERPPLYLWAVQFTSLFYEGEVTPLVARIPGALSMLLLVMLAAWWSYRHLSRYPRDDDTDFSPESYALLTGLMIVANPEILDIAREGTSDSLFALLTFAALYCLGESFETRRSFYADRPWRHWVLAGYSLIGLAMLTKGPVAFLFVLLPYVATCLNYKMRRPDWIHLPALALALLIGGWWYVVAMRIDPQASKIFFAELFSKRFGADAYQRGPIYLYVRLALVSFFPWILLAAALAYRNVRRIERTPTQLTWSWSLVCGLVWLSFIGSKREEFFTSVAPFILLLAGEALARWDFSEMAGRAFFTLLRASRWACIAVLFVLSLLIASDLGLVFAAALFIFSAWFVYHVYRTTYAYDSWEKTTQAAAMLILVFVAAEIVYVRDVIPRKSLLSPARSFPARVRAHLPPEADLFYFGAADTAIYTYYMGRRLAVISDIDEVVAQAGEQTYLLTDSEVPRLLQSADLASTVVKYGGDSMRPRAALFKVFPPAGAEGPPPLLERLATAPPLRIAVLGDAGRGGKSPQKAVAQVLLAQDAENPFHEILLLGDFLAGDSKLERIDFRKTFERPYKDLLRRGAPFHALLGMPDQDIAPILVRYPAILWGEAEHPSYYARKFYGGLARYYALDSSRLDPDTRAGRAQWDWLEQDLAASTAPWKIVALHRPILSRAIGAENDEAIAAGLAPLFERHGVQIVLWSSEPWYQRLEFADRTPVFFGVGFGGRSRPTQFADDPALKASYTEKPGFLVFEISTDQALFWAFNSEGVSVDRGVILRKDPGSEEKNSAP